MAELETLDPEREPRAEDTELEETEGGGGASRWLVGIGAAVLIAGMFLTWYHVVRPNGFAEDTTGWQTFTKLRYVILGGGIVALVSVVLVPTRAVRIVRVVIGLVTAGLVLRRIISPPDLPGSTVTAQLGIYISLLGSVGILMGGLIGGEVDDDELAEDQPAEPIAALPPGEADVVDAEPVEATDTRELETGDARR